MKGSHFYISCVLSLVLTACETTFDKQIDFEIPRVPDQITLDARLISGDSVFMLPGISSYSLSTSSPKTDTNFTIHLFENGRFVEQLRYDTTYPGGFFSGRYKIKAQHQYKLEASLEGYPTASGQDFVPEQPEIISTNIKLSGAEAFITVDFMDRAGTNDIYKFSLMYDYKEYPGGPWKVTFTTYDPTVEIYYHEEILDEIKGQKTGNTGFIKDNSFEGTIKRIELKCQSHRLIDSTATNWFELSRVTSNLYEHEKSKSLYSRSSELDFLAEPVQVYSNVKNGIGIVAAESPTRATLRP